MGRKYPEKLLENPEIVEFPKKKTIQPKLPEIARGKSHGAQISGENIP